TDTTRSTPPITAVFSALRISTSSAATATTPSTTKPASVSSSVARGPRRPRRGTCRPTQPSVPWLQPYIWGPTTMQRLSSLLRLAQGDLHGLAVARWILERQRHFLAGGL